MHECDPEAGDLRGNLNRVSPAGLTFLSAADQQQSSE